MRKILLALFAVLEMINFSTVTNVQADSTNKYGIKIDGNFDDWKDFHKVDIIDAGRPNPVKQAALLADNDNIYYYIKMDKAEKANFAFQANDYDLSIGNNWHAVIDIKNASYIKPNANTKVRLEDTSHAEHFLDKSEAIVHRYKHGDVDYCVMEWKVPFKDLGITPSESVNITMKTPILGQNSITTTGGSTGPIILAIIGLVIASLGVFQVTRRKRLR